MVGRILVLDDEENYAEMLQNLLQQHRFLVDSATEPEKAIEALKEEDYQLVISDYKMPVMDGADFLQKAREIKPDLPVILVSGLMNTPELVKVANMSVTLVLEKPIDVGDFIDHVKRFVATLSEEDYDRLQQAGEGVEEAAVTADGVLVRTYPRELRYLSDRSGAMNRFLQRLWDAGQKASVVMMQGAPGVEFDLVVREVAPWFGSGSESPVFLSADNLDQDRIATLVENSADDGRLVLGAIDVSSWTDEDQVKLASLAATLEQSEKVLLLIGVVSGDEAQMKLAGALAERLANNDPILPALAERILDLAEYAVRLLESAARRAELPERGTLTEDGIAVLLQYPWPGNYRQLNTVLRAAALLRETGPVSADDIRASIGDADIAAQGADLESVLQKHQVSILKGLCGTDKDLASVLEAMEISEDSLKGAERPENLPFLFKGLLP